MRQRNKDSELDVVGKLVIFFADEVDFGSFLRFAETKGFLAYPRHVQSGETPIGALPTAFASAAKETLWYLPDSVSPSSLLYESVRYDEKLLALNMFKSPAIEVRPCATEIGTISHGRIFYYMNSQGDLSEKGEKAYQQLARFIRKWKRTNPYGFYAGPHTCTEAIEGRLRLLHWGEEMSIR